MLSQIEKVIKRQKTSIDHMPNDSNKSSTQGSQKNNGDKGQNDSEQQTHFNKNKHIDKVVRVCSWIQGPKERPQSSFSSIFLVKDRWTY